VAHPGGQLVATPTLNVCGVPLIQMRSFVVFILQKQKQMKKHSLKSKPVFPNLFLASAPFSDKQIYIAPYHP